MTPAAADDLVIQVHDVMKLVLRRLHPNLEAEGISMGQFWALHLVSSLESASLSTIARHLSVSAPTLCVSVDQLEASGLLTRQRSTRDRRAVELALTGRGRKVEARIWARMGLLMAEVAADLPSDDLATTVRVFRELRHRLEASEDCQGGHP
ncbi:MAG: MarR family winged helix-turn-helix transcriptional regulator [Thermoplasmata archaeon]